MNEQSTSEPETAMDKIFGALRAIGIRRRTDDKWVAGVCSGLADRLGIDPVIIRAGLILLSLLGIGITIYLIAWVLVPSDKDEIVAQRALRDADGASIVLSVLAVLSLFAGSAFSGSWWGVRSGWGFPWGVALTALLIWWLLKRSGDNRDADQRVAAIQLGTPGAAGASAPASGPVPPQTQVLPENQGLAQTLGPAPSRVTQQTRLSPRARAAPRRLRRRSGGPLMALLAIGLALATYGSLFWAGNTFGWTGNHAAIALAGSLAAIGLLLVVLGLAGWRGGFVTLLAVILAASAWANTLVPSGIQVSGRVGDAVWTPTSPSAGTNYRLGVGDGVLDLSRLPATGMNTVTARPTIAASVGIGDLKVMVPPGLTVKVVGHVSLGEILLPTDPGSNGKGGSEVSRSAVIGQGPTEVVVNAAVGIGQLTVVKE